ncbi:MAG: hypothetical protein OER92_08600 [Alphaproteobacteria bacterium]|nr:hypothetical protein [Alphaproteobacteria bacterium]
MNVTNTTSTLQALLRQLESTGPASVAKAKSQEIQKVEAAHPQVTPSGQTDFNPNSPRGTYLNIVV